MFGRKNRPAQVQNINLLELVPETIVESTMGDDGIVTILGPRFKSDFMKKHVGARLKSPYFKIKLDEIGTAVWESIDGQRDIGEIARILRDKFGERIEPCHDRLSMFFTQLEMSQYVRYTNLEEVKARTAGNQPPEPPEDTPTD
jgi:hypothetical protein